MCIMSQGANNGVGKEDRRRDGPPACAKHANGPDQPVGTSNRRGCRGSCHSPAKQKGGCDMPDDLKGAIDQIANSLQTVTLLSTRLRRDLGESAQRAVELEAAADQAVRVLKRLQPKKPR